MTILARSRNLLLAGLVLAPVLGATLFAAAPRAAFTFDGASEKDTLNEARAALAAKDPQKACDLITAYLTRAVGTVELEDALGQALLQLGRKDEATHHFSTALKLVGDVEAAQKPIKGSLTKADPLYTKRSSLMSAVSKDLSEICQKLYDTGHKERALSMLTALEPIATGAQKKMIVDLAAKIRAANEERDLNKGRGEEAEASEFNKLEGQHYKLEAKLGPGTVQSVAEIMDDIFNYYVQVYFDGDVKRLPSSVKPTIRIFGSHAEMMQAWPGEQRPGLGGWWSPGEWTVTCYDTGDLSQMYETLYHEASHHFMSMLAGGTGTPAWLNEGTASFFEGAKAMADRKVLWPDAADARLRALQYQLSGGPGPSVAQVISFNQPGSYPGDYYSYGWGLIYFLQQYEDPITLEYVFRPLYSSYRETIAKKGGDPMALFKEVFLGPNAPGGITDFDAWVTRWRNWILNEVYPLNHGSRMRDLRFQKALMYIAAADKAKAEKTPPKVTELELLTRALGQLEYIRKRIDGESKVDVDLIVQQADVFERMGRPQSTAAMLKEVLDLVDSEKATLEEERYAELEKRLAALDAKNQPLRVAKNKSRAFANRALKLLDEYAASPVPMTLTSYEAAKVFADALENKKLAELAETLRLKARDAGLLHGALYRIGGRASSWVTIFDNAEDNFDPGESKIGIAGVRPVGRIFTGVPLSGEYELRTTLGRVGEVSRTTIQGVVFAGSTTGPWYSAGIDGKGQLILLRHEKNSSERRLKIVKLDPLVAKDESPTLAIHVYPGNKLVIQVGARPPVEITLEEPLPSTAYVGILSKNGRTELSDTILEVFP